MLEAGSHLPPPLDVHRLNSPDSGNEVGHLIVSSACLAPGTEVFLTGVLSAMLQLADLGEVPTALVGKSPSRERGILANLTEPGTQRFARLLDGSRQGSGWLEVAMRNGLPPGGFKGNEALVDQLRVSGQLMPQNVAIAVEVGEGDGLAIEQPAVIAW